MDASSVVTWLVDGCPGARGPAAVVTSLSERLIAAGLPIDRVAAYVRTLHPSIAGRRFVWTRGKEIEVSELPYAILDDDGFRGSTLARVFLTGERFRRRADDPESASDGVTQAVFAEGYSELYIAPLTFLSGEVHGVSFATRARGGFDDDQIAAFDGLLAPLSRVAEILALTRTATNLLDTYVGRSAGGRILAGKIQRGDLDTIHAVIWFSDLRGFTALAAEVPPDQLIRALNELFECQIPAIERGGGEVLKFMGDGLFAIFPILESGLSVGELCERALTAAESAFAALVNTNERRRGRGAPPLRFGLALHIGEVAYGNIGGTARLDFTCIGPAVNLAARLEGIASKLGRNLVFSDAFRAHTSRPAELLGEYELKGVPGASRVWGSG